MKSLNLENKGTVSKIEEKSEKWASRMRNFKDHFVDHLNDELFDFITHNVKQIQKGMLVTIMLLVFLLLEQSGDFLGS